MIESAPVCVCVCVLPLECFLLFFRKPPGTQGDDFGIGMLTVVATLTLAFSPTALRPASVVQPALQPIVQHSFESTRTSSPVASILALEAIEPVCRIMLCASCE